MFFISLDLLYDKEMADLLRSEEKYQRAVLSHGY